MSLVYFIQGDPKVSHLQRTISQSITFEKNWIETLNFFSAPRSKETTSRTPKKFEEDLHEKGQEPKGS